MILGAVVFHRQRFIHKDVIFNGVRVEKGPQGLHVYQ